MTRDVGVRGKSVASACAIGISGWAMMACSEPGEVVRASAGPPRAKPSIVTGKIVRLSASKACGNTNLERSLCMMELMIDDLRETYDWPSGGGIGDIKQASSTSYTVSLPQEERTDLFTYAFAVTDKAVSMRSKTPGTQSY